MNPYVLSNYGSKNYDTDIRGLSDDNPYLVHLRNAKNKTDYKRVLTQAIQWQTNRYDYEYQKEDADALRREERAYNSETAQVARMRAAGLNPDLLGLSGGTGGGSGTAVPLPDMQGTDLSDLSTPQETAQTVFQGINSVASLASSVTDVFSTVTDTIQGIKNFENVLRTGNATATIAENQADIISQSKEDVLQGLTLDNVMKRLGIVSDLAENYPAEYNEDGTVKVPELAQISEYLHGLGIDDAGISGMLHSYMGNSRFGAMYSDFQAKQARSRARANELSYRFWSDMYRFDKQIQLQSRDIDNSLLAFDKLMTDAFTSDENAELGIDVINQDARTRRVQSDIDNLLASEELKSVQFNLDFIAEQYNKLQAEKDNLTGTDFVSEQRRASIEYQQATLRGMRDTAHGTIASTLQRFLQNQWKFTSISGSGVTDSKLGLQNGWSFTENTMANAYQFLFNDVYSDPINLSTILEGVIKGIGLYMDAKKPPKQLVTGKTRTTATYKGGSRTVESYEYKPFP